MRGAVELKRSAYLVSRFSRSPPPRESGTTLSFRQLVTTTSGPPDRRSGLRLAKPKGVVFQRESVARAVGLSTKVIGVLSSSRCLGIFGRAEGFPALPEPAGAYRSLQRKALS